MTTTRRKVLTTLCSSLTGLKEGWYYTHPSVMEFLDRPTHIPYSLTVCYRTMGSLLSQVSGHPGVTQGVQHQDVFERVDILLSGWESVLHSLPQLTYTPDDQLDPVQLYLYKQVSGLRVLSTTLNKYLIDHGCNL